MTRAAWVVIALVFVCRAVAAFSLPLTGDEAYYWEWSRRLAFGYADHPPAVAWTIWLFSGLGHGAGFVRLGFVVCGIVATLATAATATLLARDARAGAVAAFALTVAPLCSVLFATATPDGPYLAFWALALLCATRLARTGGAVDGALLGIALGGLLLSRLFGFALVAGLVAYALTPGGARLRGRGLWIALGLAALIYSPFLAWNAQHDWVTFWFSLVHRHEGEGGAGFSFARFVLFMLTQALAYSPGIWVAVLAVALQPLRTLMSWTGVPLLAFLLLFVCFRQVEVNWTAGAFVSLCVLAGMAAIDLEPVARVGWTLVAAVPAVLLTGVAFAAALAPGPAYAFAHRAFGLSLRNAGPIEVFAFRPLALDVARLTRANGAIAMTDGYGFSSVLDYEAGVAPVVIGYDWQGRESHAWYPSSMHPPRALFVDKEPLATRPDFRIHLARACRRTVDGGSRAYRFGDAPPRTFYFTWCEGLRPDGLEILRWQLERA